MTKSTEFKKHTTADQLFKTEQEHQNWIRVCGDIYVVLLREFGSDLAKALLAIEAIKEQVQLDAGFKLTADFSSSQPSQPDRPA